MLPWLQKAPDHSVGAKIADELSSSDGEEEDAGLLWRCRQLNKIKFIAIAWILGMLKHTINPSIPYITNSFFAQAHGGGDCARTPKSGPCQEGAADAAYWHTFSEAGSHLLAFPFAVALGSCSDHVGRLPILRLSSVLSALVFFALAAHVQAGWTLWIYLVANPLVEAFDCNGVFIAILMDVQHIIPDQKERTAAWQMFAVVFAPLMIASMVASFLVPQQSVMVVSLLATVGHLVWVLFFYPETASLVSPEQRRVGSAVVFQDVRRVLCRNTFIQRMAVIVGLQGFVVGGKSVIMPPYMTGVIGITRQDRLKMFLPVLPIVLAWMVATFAFLTRLVGEVRLLRIGTLAGALVTVALVFCYTQWQVIVVFAALFGPMVSGFIAMVSLKSQLVTEDEQGTVQGLTAGLSKGGATAGLLFFGWEFRHFTNGVKDLRQGIIPPFLTNAAVAFVAVLLTCTLPVQVPEPPATKADDEEELKPMADGSSTDSGDSSGSSSE